MAEDSKGSTFKNILITIGVGVAIIAIVNWLSKPKEPIYPYNPSEYAFMAQTQEIQKQEPVTIYNWKPLSHIPSVDDLNLKTLTPETKSIVKQSSCSQCSTSATNLVSSSDSTGMKQIQENEENWEFQKDARGRITGVSVHRKLYSAEDK